MTVFIYSDLTFPFSHGLLFLFPQDDDDYNEGQTQTSSSAMSAFDVAFSATGASKSKKNRKPAKKTPTPAIVPANVTRPLNTYVDREHKLVVSTIKPGETEDMEELNKNLDETTLISNNASANGFAARVAPNTAAFLKKKAVLVKEQQTMSALEKPSLHLVVVGHVDSGKSTLIGHLLLKQGRVTTSEMRRLESEAKAMNKSSFRYAWVLDQNAAERSRGITVDVGHNWFETQHHRIVVLDCPGHRDFVPNLITGAAQADAGILVVAATPGEFEAGFKDLGQTREHATLLKALGVTQVVVAVNKMDASSAGDNEGGEIEQYSHERFNQIRSVLGPFLKALGFASISFVPISGIDGINLSTPPPPSCALSKWYPESDPGAEMEFPAAKGTLLEHVDSFVSRAGPDDANRPFRMVVADVFSTVKHGLTASGKILAGSVVPKERLLLMPQGIPLMVKAVERANNPLKAGIAGEAVDLAVKEVGMEELDIRAGHILCDIASPVPLVSRFKATLIAAQTRGKIPILPGSELQLYSQSATVSATVTKIIGVVHTNGGLTGGPVVSIKKARFIPSGATAQVEITFRAGQEMCLEAQSDCPDLSRFTLRREGDTAAVGVVEEILERRN